MLTRLNQFQEQWGGNSDVIDHWLSTRQDLLVEYCKLAGLPPFDSSVSTLPDFSSIQSFTQHLIDYISEGHFKIYNMVMEKWDATGFSPTEEMSQLYAHITKTTDPILNFTDKYSKDDEELLLSDFDNDFSTLGEIIEARFELEDGLIEQISSSLAHPPGA
ncbi:Rsd/AlgQ family anti-sigma factor [Aliivibrio fischeri]|uniref:Rsd/AlgQ family anti-sigma factor n=1 Tax=Aliivibrio fischeri TaxID=668 RepID=UPI0007C550FA|nr:Rsd/AlgQ family anti-sigma factor [Aliivibrio fischeri]MBP3143015.1 Rsd/AlgQ family anti-sigma factor [Aliivibrio fischeri]MBP3156364.1 Rsd/AlgQ family anti-sigma factor [Aliivibrio fischeri]MCE7556820.1 Rsd/AlgQ family anti-sigma factor [Aliivibrio fischeri]MCE7564243.1 Rsd/AlgQ family anti-sigma factor [Aliivibrio fischeri]MCE7567998.1 Rsd/AlgQ family anti-sigma factor [Aliivibrio fischeri]